MARREYQGGAVSTTITGGITPSTTSLVLTATTGWPTGSFSAVIDPGQAGEEKILCTSRSGATVTITTRGYDGTVESSHVAGATIYPVPTAIDFDEANAHTTASAAVHGLTGTVVGTTDTQTLTNKSLSDSTTLFVDVADATKILKVDVTGTTGVTGTLQSAFTTAKTLTLPDATDTLVGKATTDTLTNKTLTSPTINTPVLPLLTTTGDIIYASGANTPARLGIGSTSQVLTVAGGVPSWATPATAGGVLASITRNSASDLTTTSTSMVAIDTTNLRVTFTAPASGAVILLTHFYGNTSAGVLSTGFLDGATLKCSQTTQNQPTGQAAAYLNGLFKVTGLTPSTSYTYDFCWKVASGTGTLYGNSLAESGIVVLSA